jgi:hypothetical protein
MRFLLGDEELRVLALRVIASAVMPRPTSSRNSGCGANRVISLVLPSTRAWPRTVVGLLIEGGQQVP